MGASAISCSPYIIRIRFANLYVLHEAVALPTARQGLPSRSNGREGDLHQLIHACNTRQTEGWSQDYTKADLEMGLKQKIRKRKNKEHFVAHYLQKVSK